MNTGENLFRMALTRVKNDQKALDKPAKCMVDQYMLDGRIEPYQDIFDDAVAERLSKKGNKEQQATVSAAWTLCSKRLYGQLGQKQLRPIFPSICSGGKVEIKTIAEARRDNAVAVQVKADTLRAAAERSATRSEDARIDKMRNATAESIAQSLRETLALSGVSVSALAWEITHGENPVESWETLLAGIAYLAQNGAQSASSAASATSIAAPSLETA